MPYKISDLNQEQKFIFCKPAFAEIIDAAEVCDATAAKCLFKCRLHKKKTKQYLCGSC